MNGKKTVTLFPGGFQMVKNYGGYPGVDIWTREKFQENVKNSDYFIGHSGGANFAVRYAANQTSKFILINPLVQKRNIFFLLWLWLKFLILEGIRKEKIIPVKFWFFAFKRVIKLVKMDFLTTVKSIPLENLIVIRGRKDSFFCDEGSAKIIKDNNIKLIEVDAGHDWNENIAKVVQEVIHSRSHLE